MFKKFCKYNKKNESGSVVVITALAFTVLLCFAAVSIDLGIAYSTAAKTQTACDAAALAGASKLPNTTLAREEAEKYASLNGISPDAIDITFNNSNESILVTAKTESSTYFLPIVNINKFNISKQAEAKKTKDVPDAFKYRLFGNNDFGASIMLNVGNGYFIDGPIHSNGDIMMNGFSGNGKKQGITGAVEACDSILNNTGYSYHLVENAPYINMPDYSYLVDNIFPDGYNGFTKINHSVYNSSLPDGNVVIDGDLTIKGTVNGNIWVKGDVDTGRGKVTINGNIYAEGEIYMSNPVDINGSIIAKGDIDIMKNPVQNASNTGLCMCSTNGDITLNVNNGKNMKGIIYAPNGTVILNGNNFEVDGSIVSNDIIINCIHLDMSTPDKPFDFTEMPSDKVKLIK